MAFAFVVASDILQVADVIPLATSNLGYPDLLLAAAGIDNNVWRWNGSQYAFFRKVKSAQLP